MIALIVTLAPLYLIALVGYYASIYLDELFEEFDE